MTSSFRHIQRASISLLVILLFSVISCRTGKPEKPSAANGVVRYVGTMEYEKKVKTRTVSPAEARTLLVEFEKGESQESGSALSGAVGKHMILVGDDYHFYIPAKSGGIPLTGYYVDGNSGKVEFKIIKGAVPYLYQK
jgi:hypothetical protein